MAIIFDGNKFAAERLALLKQRVSRLDKKLTLVSVVFQEDVMGMLYTNLKSQAAQEVGLGFEKVELHYEDLLQDGKEIIGKLCGREDVDGVLVQKPTKFQISNLKSPSFAKASEGRQNEQTYKQWWEEITSAIDPAKDVDCLTRVNLDKVYQGESDFLPATARAVVSILEHVFKIPRFNPGIDNPGIEKQVVVVGRSELVGKPLCAYLKTQNSNVKNLGSKDNLSLELANADVVVSATGQPGLITGEMVKEGVVVIDVGEPKGDVDFASVAPKASFITPVPGGVGPVTVVSLLENLIDMVEYKD